MNDNSGLFLKNNNAKKKIIINICKKLIEFLVNNT